MSDKSLDRAVFPRIVLEQIGSYGYRLVDPRDGKTFYIRERPGNQVFEHVAEAASLSDGASLKLDRIREIEASGNKVRYIIHRHALSDEQALIVESALIDAYEDLSNARLGHGAYSRGMMTVGEVSRTSQSSREAVPNVMGIYGSPLPSTTSVAGVGRPPA